MTEKSYFNSEPIELMRSQIHPAEYNLRQISDKGRKALKIIAFSFLKGV